MMGRTARSEFSNLVRVDVCAHDTMPEVGETHRRGQPDVPGTNDGDLAGLGNGLGLKGRGHHPASLDQPHTTPSGGRGTKRSWVMVVVVIEGAVTDPAVTSSTVRPSPSSGTPAALAASYSARACST